MEIILKTITVQDAVATGSKAKHEREMKNLLQVDVAKKMGITQAHLSGLEKGRSPWSVSMIEKFNNAIGGIK